ncbi:nickel-dependent hydrogenase large subunit [Cognatiyoonia sp. IB215182]|uniref:nickel-dependent hydrogenase large subunit n=1 Tax=Cognatiyoonia sp. IB215182 TaxID=3097353 RepID=UPI002A13A57D|nr:nickel-dependent hydrogenase large subunit [Cognatiyoonia sp. IB215182]MDX8355485.1 nickel-dependent hydrogenase large subunit [Cognatiyoonia sp. IB215182]
MTELIVGPFNRVEGDLEVRLDIEDGAVSGAYANSPLFRGFEKMLAGADPRDALTLTPRICGICSISQSAAAARALADAAGVEMPEQGGIAASILHGVENLADHITHFYLFFMPDFARPVYQGREWYDEIVTRFTATKGTAAKAALDARARLFHITGILGGKWPHTLAIQPAGVTRTPTAAERVRMNSTLKAFRRFLETHLFGAPVEAFLALKTSGDLDTWKTGDAGLFLQAARDLNLGGLGVGPRRYLSYGAYPKPDGRTTKQGLWSGGVIHDIDPGGIVEDVARSWMLGPSANPFEGLTQPDEEMSETGYSWCKAPRLNGETAEVGALARNVVDGHPLALSVAEQGGVTARIAGRILEIARTQVWLEDWVNALDPSQTFMGDFDVPREGRGIGLVEAARGSLGHWVVIKDGRIANYQIVAPTTWNFSPRDGSDAPGPLEAALVGAPVGAGETAPVSVQHIVRSFDPCMVCTVH